MIGKQEIIKKLHDLGDALDRQSTDDLAGGDTCYIAADLIKKLSAECDHLEKQLTASERRGKAAVADLHGYCKACINIAKTIDFDELAKPICRECNKIIKQNWQWRGAEKGGEHGKI